MKKALWFLFGLLFIANSILTVYNYYSIKRLSFNEGLSLTNKALLKELAEKITPDDKALED